MNDQKLFIKANQTLKNVVNQIKPQEMDRSLSDEMAWMPNQTLKSAINICAYENKCVPDVLAGARNLPTNAEMKEDLLGDDPIAAYNIYSDAADKAVEALTDPGRIVHVSYGDFSASDYLRDVTIQRSFSAYDIAKFIGADTTFPDELVEGLWSTIVPVAEYLRKIGVFGEEIKVPENESLQNRLLGLTGRQPEL